MDMLLLTLGRRQFLLLSFCGINLSSMLVPGALLLVAMVSGLNSPQKGVRFFSFPLILAGQNKISRKSEDEASKPEEEGFINCCFSFTIKRDKWGVPSMIVGNFIKC